MNIMGAIAAASLITLALATGHASKVNAQDAGKCGLYEYRADIRRVVDGDTVDADIDLGFNVWLRNERLRLYRIDAPETRGASKQAGIASTKALTEKINGKRVTICTVKDRKGKYGRYLATVWLENENVNAWLVSNGFAVWRDC